MEIGKYYKLEFVFLFCFVFPQRAALPATDSYKRNSERARVGGDHGVISQAYSWWGSLTQEAQLFLSPLRDHGCLLGKGSECAAWKTHNLSSAFQNAEAQKLRPPERSVICLGCVSLPC